MSSTGNSGKNHGQARRQRLWSIAREEKETCAREAAPHNELPKMKKAMPYLVTDPDVWQETIRSGQVIEAAEADGKSSQFAEVKAI